MATSDTLARQLPPQNLDAERAVLGSMLVNSAAVPAALGVLRAEDFYREPHRQVFRAMTALENRGDAIDAVTVSEGLSAAGVLEEAGGQVYLFELAKDVISAANVVHYAEIVREHALLRRLIAAGQEVSRIGFAREKPAIDLVNDAEQLVFRIAQQQLDQDFVPVKDLLVESMRQLQLLYDRNDDVTGLATGFTDLDAVTSGLQNANLVIIAARPAMGKTSLALNIVRNVGVQNRGVAVFSLEMSKLELTQRLMCAEARVDVSRLRAGKLKLDEWSKVTDACDRLANTPIFIDDSAGITMAELRAKARRLKSQENLGLIVIDYLQLMSSPGHTENRQQEVSQISRQLKILAKDLDCPVVALSQLSRRPEDRNDKRPMLSDLRDSGAIEQDADIVLFIYRDGVYHKESETPNEAELIIAKHRNGPTGTVNLIFLEQYTSFENMVRRPRGPDL